MTELDHAHLTSPGPPSGRGALAQRLRSSRGAARIGVIAAVVFLIGGAVIGSAVWFGWGSTPAPSRQAGSGPATSIALGNTGGGSSTTTGSGRGAGPVADSLAAIWCGRRDACIAVGNDDVGPLTKSLSEMRGPSGSGWQLLDTPRVPGATLEQLSAVSCAGDMPSWCVAVGTVLSPVRHAISEVFDGRSWRLLPTPPVGEGDSLSGVACLAVGKCIAVGSAQRSSGQSPLVEELSGDTWSVMPAASGTGPSALSAISCGDVCVAVGEAATGGRDIPLAEQLVSGSWQVTTSSLPASATGGGLFSAVDCTNGRPVSCTAVGVQYDRAGRSAPLIEQRAGRTGTGGGATGAWSLVYIHSGRASSPSLDAGGLRGALLGVSCSSAADCTAVGSRGGGPATAALSSLDPLIITEANGEWFLGGRAPIHSTAASLSGVSCVASSPCEAVGSALARPGRIGTLVVLVGSGVTAVQASQSPGL